MSDVTLRKAVPEDAAAIHELIVALATYEREPDAVKATPATLAAQMRSAQPPFECLLAERGGRAVGFALYFPTFSTWRGKQGIWLEDLFVVEAERGRGVGAALLRAVGTATLARGGARLEFSVLEWNTPAMGFYRRLGGRSLEDWRIFRFDDASLAALGA